MTRVPVTTTLVLSIPGQSAPPKASATSSAKPSSTTARPVRFADVKLFYKSDQRSGRTMMTPRDLLALTPTSLYIQYQERAIRRRRRYSA